MNRRTWMTLALAVTVGVVSCGETNAQFGGLFSRKPSVAEISVNQLRGLRLDESEEAAAQPEFVLVDVRAPEEYNVSVIPGAITKAQFERNIKRYRSSTVITYCTSGYRSGQYAAKLIGQGIKARNFKGSILGWCRAGLPLQTLSDEPTSRVHTYSSRNRVPAKYKAVW